MLGNLLESISGAACTVQTVALIAALGAPDRQVYGRGALDLIWGGGLMANQWEGEQVWSRTTDDPFELQRLLGIEPRVRITTMAGPAMFLAKLTEFFISATERSEGSEGTKLAGVRAVAADDRDARWPCLEATGQHIGHVMHALVHADLRNSQRQNYNHELGLLELYRRAYDTSVHNGDVGVLEHARTKPFVSRMQAIAGAAAADLDSHPLIAELRSRLQSQSAGDATDDVIGARGSGGADGGADASMQWRNGSTKHACMHACMHWTFERFYPAFLEPFTHDIRVAHLAHVHSPGRRRRLQVTASPNGAARPRGCARPRGQHAAGRRHQGRQEHARGVLRSQVSALRRADAAA